MAARRTTFQHGGAVHRYDRTSLRGQVCVPTGTAVQQLLPQAPYPYGVRRSKEKLFTSNGCGGTARADSEPGADGDRRATCDVKEAVRPTVQSSVSGSTVLLSPKKKGGNAMPRLKFISCAITQALQLTVW